MDDKVTYIKTEKDFKDAWTLLNNVFQIDQRMPNQVFKEPFGCFIFEEFDWAMSGEFWDLCLKSLGHIFHDSYILTTVLDPDPVNYFYHHFDYYNMVKLPIDISRSDYWNSLETGPKSSPADAMLFNSEIVVWMPMSKKWAIWGERSYGICILAFADENIRAAATPLIKTWKSTNAALSDFVDINFRDKKAFQIFADNLIRNYA